MPQNDPVFTGLFPGFHPAKGELCECGETHDDDGLRPYRAVPDAALADLAASSALVTQALALAHWVGEKRALTPSKLLRPAEAQQAARDIGLDERLTTAKHPWLQHDPTR